MEYIIGFLLGVICGVFLSSYCTVFLMVNDVDTFDDMIKTIRKKAKEKKLM